MTETLQSFKNQLETFRASTLRHHTGWRGEPLSQAYWDRLENPEKRLKELESEIALSEACRARIKAKALTKGIVF
jgi:hypothetical protein